MTEANIYDFTGRWTGTGSITGTGDAEQIELGAGEYMQSDIVETDDQIVWLGQNVYGTGDTVTMLYRTGATAAACFGAIWHAYLSPFQSLGYVQVRLQSTDFIDLLEVSGTNTRYFADESGNPVILAGMHFWYNVQDGDSVDPPVAFDWDEFLGAMLDYGHNATILWTLENSKWWPSDDTQYFSPPRYKRTGPGNANDGKLKFDLTQVNPVWLDRLESRVADCAANGIYAVVMFFNGFNVSSRGDTYNPATHHPYLSANNINSVDGDQDDDGELIETQTDFQNVVLDYQEGLIEAVVDRLNSYKNVIYTVCNEPQGSDNQNDWSTYLVDYIHTYETGKPIQHPVMYSIAYPNGSNAYIDASNAEVVCYRSDKADTAMDGTTGKVSIYDTDHVFGTTNTLAWIWQSFCNGHGGQLDMDNWITDTYGDFRNDANWIAERANLGYLLTLVGMLNDLLNMTPQPTLVSPDDWCLAKDHATAAEYVVYYNGTGTFDLDLTTATGTLNIRWLRCSDGTVQDSATVAGGNTRTLTPPWTGSVVAYVRHI